MTKTYYYELVMPHKTITNVVRFANFNLRYLMARKMSSIAVRHSAKLTVKTLTLKMAIKIKIKSMIGE
jgi:hypothetical protein